MIIKELQGMFLKQWKVAVGCGCVLMFGSLAGCFEAPEIQAQKWRTWLMGKQKEQPSAVEVAQKHRVRFPGERAAPKPRAMSQAQKIARGK
ncbi:MAG: hypothetical protein AAGJ35_05725, partial [Myxococcota bacterium]